MDDVRGVPLPPSRLGKIESWHQFLRNRTLLENDELHGDIAWKIGDIVICCNELRKHESISNPPFADPSLSRRQSILLS